jgi:hypothetical protein
MEPLAPHPLPSAARPPLQKNPPKPPNTSLNPSKILHPTTDPLLPQADLPFDRSFPSSQGCGGDGASLLEDSRRPLPIEPSTPGSAQSSGGASSPVIAQHVQFDASSTDSSGDEASDGCASPFGEPLCKGKGEMQAAMDARPPPRRRASRPGAFMPDAHRPSAMGASGPAAATVARS